MVNIGQKRDFDFEILTQIFKGDYDNFNTLTRKLKIDPTKLKERINFLTKEGIIKKHLDRKAEFTKTPNSHYYEIISDIEKKPLALVVQYERMFDWLINEINDLAKQLEKERLYKFLKVENMKPYGTQTHGSRNKKAEAIFDKLCKMIDSTLTKSQGIVYAQVLESIPKKYHNRLDKIHKNLILQITKAIKRVIKSQKIKSHRTQIEQDFKFRVFSYNEFNNVDLVLKQPDVKWF